jgi:hypothetical protein
VTVSARFSGAIAAIQTHRHQWHAAPDIVLTIEGQGNEAIHEGVQGTILTPASNHNPGSTPRYFLPDLEQENEQAVERREG